MTRYICETCDMVFDEPLQLQDTEQLGEGVYQSRRELCPVCGGPYFTRADLCGCCKDRWKRLNEHLCANCREALKLKFAVFADDLTREEVLQLDSWLEGTSIEERRKWN